VELHEKCGVVGVKADGKDVYPDLYHGLYTLQHRGQESAGIAVENGGISVVKGMGLVSEALKNQYLQGDAGIGHVRYSNTGCSSIQNSQPLLIKHSCGSFALAHNGNLVNYHELLSMLEGKGNIFTTTSDTEVIAQLIARENIRCQDFTQAIANAMKYLVGSYSLVILHKKEIYAVRDPNGIRPLAIGKTPDGYIVASESCVFGVLGYEFVRDVKPGEIVCINDGLHSMQALPSEPKHCMFEYVYFARPDSLLDGHKVYTVRRNLGINLGKTSAPKDADMVIAVPDSGINHAIGYAEGSGIRYGEGLIKNRYVGRTFIFPQQDLRERGVRLKLNAIKSQVAGKKIVMVDDSIVRGTTTRKLVKVLRDAGAKEVHARVACPPIRSPCYYGIDMQNAGEFIANGKTVEEIAKEIGADTLEYSSIESLVDAIGIPKENLCMACLTGEYPVKEKQAKLTDL